ncbi:MAG: acetyltransferase [Bacteroidia bacterium]|jgi:sugar O-acyltransferase (sialic acid O-acetyltransferase NeuD family)
MKKDKKLIIIGTGETADIAFEYFTYDSEYEVVGYAASEVLIRDNQYNGLPVYPFEKLLDYFTPKEVKLYIAISYVKLNRVRKKLFLQAKDMGFTCANYISSRAFLWRNVEMGENNFIFENNVIQHKVKLGNNIILWSGNHIGHQTRIEDHVYITSHCVISGFCTIGESSFIGVNSTFNDTIILGKDNIVGSGALIVKNTEDGKLMIGSPAKPALKTSYETFKVNPEEI